MDISHRREGGVDSPSTRAQDRIRTLLGAPPGRAEADGPDTIATEPFDVRDFMLDPPPTDEQLERSARRRTVIRRASVVAAALVGIALVIPLPGGGRGGTGGAEAPVATSADVAAAAPDVATAAPEAGTTDARSPQRIDKPVRPRQRRAGPGPTKRIAPPRTRPVARSAPVASAAAAPTPAPPVVRTPTAVRPEPAPAPAPMTDDAVLVPMG